MTIPFANFTDLWSSATGEPTKTCQEDASACVTAKDLAKISRMQVWGEGKLGKLHIEVKEISATVGSAAPMWQAPPTEAAPPPAAAPVVLASFDGSKRWEHQDDPVMGGQSKSTFTQEGGVGVFDGECAIVPSLKVIRPHAPPLPRCIHATQGATAMQRPRSVACRRPASARWSST